MLGLILGGVLGNLYDRVGLPGLDWKVLRPERAGEHVYAVRDFVLLAWQWPPQSRWDVWPNFNVADSLLVCGAVAIVLLSCGDDANRRALDMSHKPIIERSATRSRQLSPKPPDAVARRSWRVAAVRPYSPPLNVL